MFAFSFASMFCTIYTTTTLLFFPTSLSNFHRDCPTLSNACYYIRWHGVLLFVFLNRRIGTILDFLLEPHVHAIWTSITLTDDLFWRFCSFILHLSIQLIVRCAIIPFTGVSHKLKRKRDMLARGLAPSVLSVLIWGCLKWRRLYFEEGEFTCTYIHIYRRERPHARIL